MALMYDMETVNRAMTVAAKLYDPKRPSIRVKRVLDIFAGMKPVEVAKPVHGQWEYSFGSYCTTKCSCCGWHIPYSEDSRLDARNFCPACGAIMDGRVEE